ncbi:S1C family serine protease [Planosporangium sp. 12N6]|uniref:S1C family serine protease n=1 Tax=Planosporangium spinosum TaxID=3402278 RepID=UPI003CE77DCC
MTPIEPVPDQPGAGPAPPASPCPQPPAGPLPRWMPDQPYRTEPSAVLVDGSATGLAAGPVIGPATAPAGPPTAPPHRWRTRLASGLAAVVLALCAGLTGGYLAHRMDGMSGTPFRIGTPARGVVDRSSLAAVAAAVQPSVVSIDAGPAEGSGVVLTSDGYVLTNNHVVSMARNRTVELTFAGGRTATAGIVGTDSAHDVAVVRANGVSGLDAATFGDSDKVRVGDTVLAIGSPLGLQGTVTAGIVSALHRDLRSAGRTNSGASFAIADAIQTDAAINPGNSGGALVDNTGRVVGINTAIATAGQSQGNIGVGFAIPSNTAKQIANQIIGS